MGALLSFVAAPLAVVVARVVGVAARQRTLDASARMRGQSRITPVVRLFETDTSGKRSMQTADALEKLALRPARTVRGPNHNRDSRGRSFLWNCKLRTTPRHEAHSDGYPSESLAVTRNGGCGRLHRFLLCSDLARSSVVNNEVTTQRGVDSSHRPLALNTAGA